MMNRTAYFYDPDVGNFHYGKSELCVLAEAANQCLHSKPQTIASGLHICDIFHVFINKYVRPVEK